ncbi:hypothetical protein CN395_29420 [Priestia megaterium]|uniref:hypothetical protein n=1 Tax=Priestia megaterium TaxID=1404 RepID=UPI000BF3860C|nr:hypothetical protein [Priestia megaterium]PEU50778.1 hypothetical protein CN395_29420 [Priestia megaterium]
MAPFEINSMIENLVNYEDSDITYTLANKYKLSYTKKLKSVQICDIEKDIIHYYGEIDKATLALFNMLHNKSMDI